MRREPSIPDRCGPAGERGYVREKGADHDHTDLEPAHEGWADEYRFRVVGGAPADNG